MTTGRPPLVGRDAELEQIAAELDRSRSESAVGTLVIEGPPGLGKSSLLAATNELARAQGFAVAAHRCERTDLGRPFGVLADTLSHLQGVEVFDGLLGDHPTERRTPALVADVPEHRNRVVGALVPLLADVAARHPLLLALDDAQWADASTVHALSAAVDRLRGRPVVLASTLRSDELRSEAWPAFADIVRGSGRHLVLEPLDDGAVRALIRARWGAPPGPHLQRLLDRLGGHPLFLVELLDDLEHEQALVQEMGVVEVTSGTRSRSFHRRTLQRLGSMPRDVVRVVRAVAVLDAPCTTAILGVVARSSSDDLDAALATACRERLLVRDGPLVRFRHDLVRDILLESIGETTRRNLHLSACRALEAAHAPPSRIARHAVLAEHQPGLDAAQWLLRAAEHVDAVAPAEALVLLREAASHVPSGDPLEIEIHMRLVQALAWTGAVDECRELTQRLLEQVTDVDRRVSLHRFLAICAFANNEPGEAARWSDRSVLELPEGRELSRALAESAIAHLTAADPDHARQRAGEAIRVGLVHDDHVGVCVGHTVLSRLAAFDLDMDASLEHADLAVAASRADPDDDAELYRPDLFRAMTLADLGRLEEAAEAVAIARPLLADSGATWSIHAFDGLAAAVEWLSGDFTASRAHADTGIDTMDEFGSSLAGVWLHSLRAMVALHRADVTLAERDVSAATELMSSRLTLLGADVLALAQCRLLEATGDRRGALELLQASWELFEALGVPGYLRITGMDLVRLALLESRPELAERATTRLEDLAHRPGGMEDQAAALFARAMVSNDVRLFDQAIATFRSTPYRARTARCVEEAGAIRWAARDRVGAAEHLEHAMELWAGCGATADVARVQSTFRALGLRRSRPRRRAVSGWDALTPRERSVVELVREGHSNPTIGTRLNISPRTVESHLARIFPKLGVSSRVQLALVDPDVPGRHVT